MTEPINPSERLPRFAVLLSGSGRTLANLLQSIDEERLIGEVVVVVSSKPDVRGIDIARDAGIPTFVIERREFDSDQEFSRDVYRHLDPFRPDLILMAGFLRRLLVADRWSGRILNIHPALLPEAEWAAGKGFYGDRVHAEVLDRGVDHSGATVHLVDDDYDSGQILDRYEVPVLPDDTVERLAGRVFAAECTLYPRAISAYLEANPNLIDSIRGA